MKIQILAFALVSAVAANASANCIFDAGKLNASAVEKIEEFTNFPAAQNVPPGIGDVAGREFMKQTYTGVAKSGKTCLVQIIGDRFRRAESTAVSTANFLFAIEETEGRKVTAEVGSYVSGSVKDIDVSWSGRALQVETQELVSEPSNSSSPEGGFASAIVSTAFEAATNCAFSKKIITSIDLQKHKDGSLSAVRIVREKSGARSDAAVMCDGLKPVGEPQPVTAEALETYVKYMNR